MIKILPLYFLVCILLGFAIFIVFFRTEGGKFSASPERLKKVIQKPLQKYSFESLKQRQGKSSEIYIQQVLEEKDIKSYLVSFKTDGKKVSGFLNTPTKPGIYPVIVMLRGYVDKKIYETGVGTKRAGEVYAKNGFVTIAPDFLGYGKSDYPSTDSLEERFQTYTTALDLLASIGNLNKTLEATNSGRIKVDPERVGIWGHSNGGHIALSVLSIVGKSYPTVLWNPVSKPFPYSVLFYTDEFDDNGKSLRKVISEFEEIYDIEKFSSVNYYSWIQSPIQIHQGANDEAVPYWWSGQLKENLKNLKKEVTYFVYPNSDHNLMPGGWQTAVEKSILFYRESFGKEK